MNKEAIEKKNAEVEKFNSERKSKADKYSFLYQFNFYDLHLRV